LGVYINNLKLLIELLDTGDTPFVNLKDNSKVNSKSVIDRLGIAGELLKLRGEPGQTISSIAKHFGLPENTVKRFFKYYDSSKPSIQTKLRRTSIFDTATQLENLAVIIQRNMARLEASDDATNAKFVAEMREIIKLASVFAKEMSNYEQFNRMKQIVFDILLRELPARRTEILQKIEEANNNPLLAKVESSIR
jgi:transposase-like protein